MDPVFAYFACVAGAAGVYLLLKPGRRGLKVAGALLGLGAFVWLLFATAQLMGFASDTQTQAPNPNVVFAIFSLIAIASAARMITHSRPVYSALYFVMVVLSSAGLFLLLQAEFMAFALVIVYAGAILITYMFVLMLAQQAPSEPSRPAGEPSVGSEAAAPEYDRIPREPGYAAVVGFIMLALFSHMIFRGGSQVQPAVTPDQAIAQNWQRLRQMPQRVQRAMRQQDEAVELAPNWNLQVIEGVAYVDVIREGQTQPTLMPLPADALPGNIQLVGLDLVAAFPVSLELAGVILLLAMFGAVVLARKQIEIGEDEVREAAGMRKLALHSDDHHSGSPAEISPGGER